MSASSGARPPGLRGMPGRNPFAPTTGGHPADSAGPFPRKPVATDDAPSKGRRRKLEPEAAPLPEQTDELRKTEAPEEGVAQPQPPKSRGLPSERGIPRLNVSGRGPESKEDEIPILEPAALDPRQAKKKNEAPPPRSNNTQAEQTLPSFAFTRPQASTNNIKGAPGDPEPQVPNPLRTKAPQNSKQQPGVAQQPPVTESLQPEQSARIPPPLNPNRPAASQQPGVPDSLRPGPPGAVPDTLRPGQPGSGNPQSHSASSQQPSFLDSLRPGKSRPVPPPQNPNRLGGSRQPPGSEPPRTGPPGPVPPPTETARGDPSLEPPPRGRPPIAEMLHKGTDRRAQEQGHIPQQPGPAPDKPPLREKTSINTAAGDQGKPGSAPNVPVPDPAKPPQREEMPANTAPGDPRQPAPLRHANLPSQIQHKAEPASTEPLKNAQKLNSNRKGALHVASEDPSKASDSSRPSAVPTPPNPQPQAGGHNPFTRKPVNQSSSGEPPLKASAQAGGPPGSQNPGTSNPRGPPPPNSLPPQGDAASNHPPGPPPPSKQEKQSKNPFRRKEPASKDTAVPPRHEDPSAANSSSQPPNPQHPGKPGVSDPPRAPFTDSRKQSGKPGGANPMSPPPLNPRNPGHPGHPGTQPEKLGAAGTPGRLPPDPRMQSGRPGDSHPLSPPPLNPRNPLMQPGNPGAADPSKPTTADPRVPGQPGGRDPLRPTPPNLPSQAGNQPKPSPSVRRPGMTSPPPGKQGDIAPPIKSPPRPPPPRGRTAANLGPLPGGSVPRPGQPPNRAPPRMASSPPGPQNGPPPRMGNPPGLSHTRPGPTHSGPSHSHSSSLDSTASSANSTRPLNPPQRQNTGLSRPARQNTVDPRDKAPEGAYYNGESSSSTSSSGPAQTPYMSMLMSLDTIPRMHNILVMLFVWILLIGFVVIPGSFTSVKRKQEGEDTVEIPISGGGADGQKLALTPANTAALVIGFVCILAGTFGSAWLALRWRRNYVWLLNKLYMPLILDALAGVFAALTAVYTQQAGEWSAQAIVTAIVEAVIFTVSLVLFFVYNYWLLQRVRSDHEEAMVGGAGGGGREKKGWRERRREKKERKKHVKKGGLLSRFRKARRKPSMAPGSVV